jgi:hypothetical protein
VLFLAGVPPSPVMGCRVVWEVGVGGGLGLLAVTGGGRWQ